MGVSETISRFTSVKAVFSEKDESIFDKNVPKYTPLVRSPVEDELATPLEHEELEVEVVAEGEPRLVRAHETSVVQLFYDLFFVANLSTFTSKHEITGVDELRSYLGFFIILWATWFQVAKYDVRFGNDSILERICKALQFGIMVGFAITGPEFSAVWEPGTSDAQAALEIYQVLTLILMASRIILTVQYIAVYYWLKDYPKVHFPLMVHIITSVCASVLFFGLFWSFNYTSNNTGRGIIGWYFTFAAEASAILFVSGRVRFMSFRHTPMVERLGLLTLIILGEGVIGLCEAISKANPRLHFGGDIVGQIITSVCIIYFLWILYSDQIEKRRVGRFRQGLWTALHLPLHVSIILVVEGQVTLTVWRKIQDLTNPLFDVSNLVPDPGESWDPFIQNLNTAVTTSFAQLPDPRIPIDISELMSFISTSINDTEILNNYVDLVYSSFINFCEVFDIKDINTNSSGEEAKFNELVQIFYNVYAYFFAAAGLTIIFLTALLRLGKREMYRTEIVVMAVRFVIGIGLCFLAFMDLPTLQVEGEAIYNYITSSWMVPTVFICYFIVVIVDYSIARYIRQKYNQWRMTFNSGA
ncbi:hypothetical protein V1525DRAFT_458995 [Lipomyces kononenkoae]|uniref:Uncharacterized protein n=1 Tax=Lipomyces kononenkoae TaxID=34357 RepID=A0ACC3STJ2_LIPKO